MLTPKQELFVKGLVEGKTQRQAYYAAYPSSRKWKEAVVDTKASALFREGAGGQVKSRFEELTVRVAKHIEKKCLVDAEYVINGLKEVADRCKQAVPLMKKQGKDMVPVLDANGDPVYAVVDSMGANKSLELMGKSLKMFTDKVEVVDGTGIAALLRERRKMAQQKLNCKPSDEEPRAGEKHESTEGGI